VEENSAALLLRAQDTRDEAERVRIESIRARSPEARLRDAAELSEMVHDAAMARLRARFPTLSKVELAFKLNGLSAGEVTTAP
jgi:hypothetical protein